MQNFDQNMHSQEGCTSFVKKMKTHTIWITICLIMLGKKFRFNKQQQVYFVYDWI